MGRAAVDRAAPNDRCTLCSPSKACAWHATRDPVELGRLMLTTLRRRATIGLADLFEALFAQTTNLPDPAYDLISVMSPKPLQQEFKRLLEGDSFSTDQLRRLAAVSLALATLYETQADDGDDDDDEEG